MSFFIKRPPREPIFPTRNIDHQMIFDLEQSKDSFLKCLEFIKRCEGDMESVIIEWEVEENYAQVWATFRGDEPMEDFEKRMVIYRQGMVDHEVEVQEYAEWEKEYAKDIENKKKEEDRLATQQRIQLRRQKMEQYERLREELAIEN